MRWHASAIGGEPRPLAARINPTKKMFLFMGRVCVGDAAGVQAVIVISD